MGWHRASHADDVIEAATALGVFAATSPGLDARPGVRREMLRLYTLNLVTQGTLPRKGDTRYVSTGVRDAPAGELLEHEHVYTRTHLADLVLANPNSVAIRWILDNLAVAATVTKAEHQELTRVPNTIHGWARYEAAGVRVIDLVTGNEGFSHTPVPNWIITPADGRRALRFPHDAVSRILGSEHIGALLDPELHDIDGARDWPTRRAEAFEVIETLSRAAGQGFPSREAAREALFPQVNGFGVRLWLQDVVLDLLRP